MSKSDDTSQKRYTPKQIKTAPLPKKVQRLSKKDREIVENALGVIVRRKLLDNPKISG